MRKKILIFILVITVLIPGIAVTTYFESRSQPKSWQEIQKGMAVSEVEKLIGRSADNFAWQHKKILFWREPRIFGNWDLYVTPDRENNVVSRVSININSNHFSQPGNAVDFRHSIRAVADHERSQIKIAT